MAIGPTFCGMGVEDKNNFRSKNDNNMIDNFVNTKVGE